MKKTFLSSEWVLRVGVFGTFLGHGVFALQQKAGWFEYFSAVGIQYDSAATLLILIGCLDLLIAAFALLKPVKIVLVWAAFWGLVTALIRPIAGEPVWDFIERTANWAAPLALLLMHGLPKKPKDWFRL
ncbi:hypothetical protein COV06_03565 [Candidatus Uhrbacteria bacterium CG10_big_fil_rev_8_21_14_0_10_50_16]|uniref:DoxX family protein n=1 Tax=Candidatus Uhrbacteria bacterium CG10_big_fil_rev_8_21_14_0_10_50_16 TaxID=1975039 RepID=A0A2H0RLS9_9BACT|nr:MAG: hypothetical protein COV06_03565 [Candidatus Uhrbacteria bacterium CG10_big_fil_rev_8_21_14_0_10_50_16]